MKKKIILFINNDEIFTFPMVIFLINKLKKKFKIYIKLENTSFRKKIKILLILILDGSIFNLMKFYKKKISLKKIKNIKGVKILTRYDESDFKYGVSINYPKKIIFKKLKIYNFHFGNFLNQRGTFIFFYKYIFKWKSIDLTFHKINLFFDAGKVLSKKTIIIKNMNAIDIIALPLKNKNFYLNSIKIIGLKRKALKTKLGDIHREPTFFKIFSTFKKEF